MIRQNSGITSTIAERMVIERRNDPALILWGLQNESKLPEDFAKECTELIRSLDPTASSQRLVTTCNGGNALIGCAAELTVRMSDPLLMQVM